MSQQRPSQQLIDEWFDSTVTEYFFSLVKNLEGDADTSLREQGFVSQTPGMTATDLQAERGNLWGFKTAFEDLYSCFEEKSLEQIEGEGDGESIGDLPEGGPYSDTA